jgi:hypothetical protein
MAVFAATFLKRSFSLPDSPLIGCGAGFQPALLPCAICLVEQVGNLLHTTLTWFSLQLYFLFCGLVASSAPVFFFSPSGGRDTVGGNALN